MGKRKHRGQDKDGGEVEIVQAQPQTPGYDAWNTSGFRNAVLIDLVFVGLPAIIMAALGQRTYAAAWFSVGLLVIIWQFWRQIRDFWRAFQPGSAGGEGGGEEQSQARPRPVPDSAARGPGPRDNMKTGD